MTRIRVLAGATSDSNVGGMNDDLRRSLQSAAMKTATPKILDLTSSELTDWIVTHGWPKFRAGQLRQWLFRRRATAFDQMSDLPKALREQLAAEFTFFSAEVESHQVSSDRTEKLLRFSGPPVRWPPLFPSRLPTLLPP